MKQAFMLHILKDDPDLNLFMFDDPNIRIYKKEKRTKRAYEQAIESEYSNIVVDAEEINRTQGETIIVASLYDMSEMTTIRPRPDSIYILSQTEAFNEEMEISQERLQNWLDHYGIPLYHTHASGHAGTHELKGMLEEVQPEIVYPVHTSHPELFRKFMADTGIEIRIPRFSEPEAVGALI
jgi:mRNA degradation ribonuclease J1/J2